eukprot:6196641-Pleurochrysis_carterae.AAC.1
MARGRSSHSLAAASSNPRRARESHAQAERAPWSSTDTPVTRRLCLNPIVSVSATCPAIPPSLHPNLRTYQVHVCRGPMRRALPRGQPRSGGQERGRLSNSGAIDASAWSQETARFSSRAGIIVSGFKVVHSFKCDQRRE